MADNRKIKGWITINGRHIPVFEGQSKAEAFKQATGGGSKGPKLQGKAAKNDDKKSDRPLQSSGEKKSPSTEFGKAEENKVKNYQEKFLKKRSDKELDELENNLKKGSKGVPTSPGDVTALEAIRRERKERQASKSKQSSNSAKKSDSASKSGSFSASDSAKKINDISMAHNNGGGDKRNDWKKVRDKLDKVPAGTVMITTGNRGIKTQYTKTEDGMWKNSNPSSPQFEKVDSQHISMDWDGIQGHRPSVEFTTPDKAMTKDKLKESEDKAVSGKYNQMLGLDKNDRKIGSRSVSKVGSNKSNDNAPEGKYTVTINQGLDGKKYKHFDTAEEAEKYVENAVHSGNGVNSDFSIKYNKRKGEKDKSSLIDVLNDKKGRELVEQLEEAEDEIKGRGIDPNDESNIYSRIRKDTIKKLKDDFNYDWGGSLGNTKSDSKNQIDKDLDDKERQIKMHQQEADIRNGKQPKQNKLSSDNKISRYSEKLSSVSNKASYLSWLVRSGKITEEEREQLRGTYKKAKSESTQSAANKADKVTNKYYTPSQLEDDLFRKNAKEELKRNQRNWDYMSSKDRRNISPNGKRELQKRLDEIDRYEKDLQRGTSEVISGNSAAEKKPAQKTPDSHSYGIEPSATEYAKAFSDADKARQSIANKSDKDLMDIHANSHGLRGGAYQELKSRGYEYKDGKWSKNEQLEELLSKATVGGKLKLSNLNTYELRQIYKAYGGGSTYSGTSKDALIVMINKLRHKNI